MFGSVLSKTRYNALVNLAKQLRTVPGVVIECGSYKLGSAIGLAFAFRRRKAIYALDTYEGAVTSAEVDGQEAHRHVRNREFAGNSIA